MKSQVLNGRPPIKIYWPGLAFLLVCALFACQPQADKQSGNLIPDEKMARIQADLNIAEAATARLNGYPKDSLRQIYFKQVMEMHGISNADYEATLRVIVTDQSRMETLLKMSEDFLQDTIGM